MPDRVDRTYLAERNKAIIKRPRAWRAHVEKYADLYERALKTPATSSTNSKAFMHARKQSASPSR
jgi:hypothetical protein